MWILPSHYQSTIGLCCCFSTPFNFFKGRTLSYRALDVEQIGYVYEGLLERTVVRAKEVR